MRYCFLIVLLLMAQVSCTSSASQMAPNSNQIKAQRRPVQKNDLVLRSPEDYSKRDLPNGKEYDPKPTIRLIDDRSGNYEFSWIGYDKKKKIVIYQREDAIDATVEARVEKDSEGRQTYKYLINNSPESPTFLHWFVVQTTSADVEPVKMDNVVLREMYNKLPGYTEGVWKTFTIREKTSLKIDPGKSIEFSLTSGALAGIVGCRVGGGQGYTIGVGEHMPAELDRLLPVNLWAKCHTIGPIERLAALSKPERIEYLLDSLPKFVEAGWMAGDTPKIYHSILGRNDLDGALEQAKKDLENEFITPEVLYIIEGLNQ